MKDKYFIYETYGVKEYWIVQQEDKTVTIQTLTAEGKFQPLKMLGIGEKLESQIFPELSVELDELFTDVVKEPELFYEENVIRI